MSEDQTKPNDPSITSNPQQAAETVVSQHNADINSSQKNIKKSSGSGIRGTFSAIIILIVGVLFVVWLLTVFVFQQYQVDGPSMQSTLQNNNRLIVLKVARTWARITGHPYVPKRGDIVVFVENDLYNLNETGSDQLIKRVIGLPGDRLVVKNQVITIYNSQHPNGFRPDATLPYGKVIGPTSGNIDITVPAGDIFVCGDNRGDSLDSRVFGPVPLKNVVGQLVLRITPLNEIGKF